MKKILNEMGNHIVNGIKYTIPLIVVYSVFSALVGAEYIRVPFDVNRYVFIVLVRIRFFVYYFWDEFSYNLKL